MIIVKLIKLLILQTNIDLPPSQENETAETEQSSSKGSVSLSEQMKDYNLVLLKHVQYIFAHLACSKLQYYVPRGFWKHFRFALPYNCSENEYSKMSII